MNFDAVSKGITLSTDYVSPEIFENIVNFIHCGSINLSDHNLESVLSAGHYLQITDLVARCVDFIIDNLKIENVVKMIRITTKFDLDKLSTHVFDFLLKSFGEFSKEDDFVLLPGEYLSALIRSDHLVVDNEVTVFHALCKWQAYNKSQVISDSIRLSLLPKNSQTLAFNYMSQTARLMHMDFMISSEAGEISPTVEIMEMHRLQRFYNSRPIYIKGNKLNTNSTYSYTAHNRKFEEVLHPTFTTRDSGFAVVDNSIYFLGGRPPYIPGSFTNFRRYNLLDCTHESLRPLHMSLYGMAVVAEGQQIYVSGGLGGGIGDFQKRMYYYLIDTNDWHALAPMPVERADHVMVSYGGAFYVFGGRSSTTQGYPVIRYDPRVKEWSSLGPTQEYIFGVSACATKDGILVAGGSDGKASKRIAKVFDPRFDNFYHVAPLNYPMEFGAVVSNGSLVYSFGYGNSGHWESNNVLLSQIYSSPHNMWLTLPDTCPLEAPIYASI